MRVLVVEDDVGIAAGLRSRLQQEGHTVDVAGGVELAWHALAHEPFDLVLLDLGLPDGEGDDLLCRLRAAPPHGTPDPETPVIVMTARDAVASRIDSLDRGADDYVVKPFDPGELAARMRALRRRARGGSAQPAIRHGEVEIEPSTRAVRRGGVPVELSGREYALLMALLDARPRALTRAQLEARLYDWGSALGSNAIEVHVHHLRRKLGEEVVRTLRGVGYFVASEAAP